MSGSRMSAAMSRPCFSRIFTQASISFHGNTTVCLSTASGTPAEYATGFGRLREPAFAGSGDTLTSTQSCVPW